MRIRKGSVSGRIGALALVLGMSASAVLVTAIPASAASVTSFTPTCGPVGTVVTITGTGFNGGVTGVIFDWDPNTQVGTAATTWAIVNDTTATATVPVGATTGYILVATPGADTANTHQFTVVADEADCAAKLQHDRSITLQLKNHLTAKGRVTVGDGFIPCRSDITVKIQRRTNGKWKTVGTDKTTGVGDYRVNVADKPGKYRASIASDTLSSGDTCAAAASATNDHHH